MIFIRHPFDCNLKYLDFDETPVKADAISHGVGSYIGYWEFSLLYNGRKLQSAEVIPDNSTVHVVLSLPGGKGGFGSMLRAIGAQIEKTTNREACRDLSGRRLRDINEEQRLKKWISKEAEREADKIKRKKARIERLKSKPAHNFFDFDYQKEISNLPDQINDALSEGLQKAKQPTKRPHETPGSSEHRKKMWLSSEFSASSSDTDSDENNAATGSSPKKLKTASKDSSSYESDISDLSQPGTSSKGNSNLDSGENLTSNSESASTEESSNDNSKENCNNSQEIGIVECKEGENNSNNDANQTSTKKLQSIEEREQESTANEVNQVKEGITETSRAASTLDTSALIKEPELQDDSPINLLDFQSVSELEALGLDRLKSELMSRGLKCGGAITDRAQRLWKIRGLQPRDYPANLLVKNKK